MADVVFAFFEACDQGDVARLRETLDAEPTLVTEENPDAAHPGWTGLHTAAKLGHAAAVRLLLERGADPKAREVGDATSPLHWAAAGGHRDVVELLLQAGADPVGAGDEHELEVIGWATYFAKPIREEVVALLLQHGAQHHVFSALCMGDAQLLREVAARDPQALERRMSSYEQGMTPLHLALDRQRHDLLAVLIELGAELEATDERGHTPHELATFRGDRQARELLQAAGAKARSREMSAETTRALGALGESVSRLVPMLDVEDVEATLQWYEAIGFTVRGRHEDNWGWLSYGPAQLMLSKQARREKRDVTLWFYTKQIEELYRLLRAQPVEFTESLYEAFYGARQFGIRDPNGYVLTFIQPAERSA